MQPESGKPGIRSVLWEATNILLEFTLRQGRKGAFTKHLLRARIREAPSGSENGGGRGRGRFVTSKTSPGALSL